MTEQHPSPPPPPGGAQEVIRAFASPRLRLRRFELLALRGEGAPYTEAQGRAPGDATAPEELADLISSIGEVGVLQPVLVEELPARGGAAPALRTVAGERRLRAARWGAVHRPDNPHFAALPAIVCPGPLSEEERRIWQLIENLAREPLRPGEQAAALLYQRCAVLTAKLLRAGKPVPADVQALTDPVARFRALERIRGGDSEAAAPWSEVLTRLGLQLSPRRARELVRAFAALPPELNEDMDAERIALHTRVRFAELRRGRTAAAEEIWAAVKGAGRTDLLYSATGAALTDPALSAGQAVAAAAEDRQAAIEARASALRAKPAGPAAAPAAVPDRADGAAHPAVGDAPTGAPEPGGGAGAAPAAADAAPAAAQACRALRALIAALDAGAQLGRYDRGSLRLLLAEATRLLPAPAASAAA